MSINPATPPVNPATPPVLPGGNVVNYLNSIDLSKYPSLALQIAAVNQIGLSLSENNVIRESNEAERSFATGSIGSGFSSAQFTQIFGGVEAAMGAVQGGSSGLQIKAAGANTLDIQKIGVDSSKELNEVTKVATADDSFVTERADQTPAQPGTTVQAEPATDVESPARTKPKAARTKREILSDRELDTEKAKSTNNHAVQSATLMQNLSQTGQFFAQSSQANSQVAQMQQQVMNNNYSAAQATAQSAKETLGKGLWNVYEMNVASSRA